MSSVEQLLSGFTQDTHANFIGKVLAMKGGEIVNETCKKMVFPDIAVTKFFKELGIKQNPVGRDLVYGSIVRSADPDFSTMRKALLRAWSDEKADAKPQMLALAANVALEYDDAMSECESEHVPVHEPVPVRKPVQPTVSEASADSQPVRRSTLVPKPTQSIVSMPTSSILTISGMSDSETLKAFIEKRMGVFQKKIVNGIKVGETNTSSACFRDWTIKEFIPSRIERKLHRQITIAQASEIFDSVMTGQTPSELGESEINLINLGICLYYKSENKQAKAVRRQASKAETADEFDLVVGVAGIQIR